MYDKQYFEFVNFPFLSHPLKYVFLTFNLRTDFNTSFFVLINPVFILSNIHNQFRMNKCNHFWEIL